MDINSIPHPSEALVLAKVSDLIKQKAKQIKLAIFDVDGVLTDGGLYFSEHGEAMKRFNALDGHGLKMLERGGVMVALVTGRDSKILSRRAAELGIGLLIQGARDKGKIVQELAKEHGVTLDELCFMGDDAIDLQAMQKVGFAVSVPNAPSYIHQMADWVTSLSGGHGAVRECTDLILSAQGLLGKQLNPNTLIDEPVVQ